MPKHLIAFLSSRPDLSDEQIAEQLPNLEKETSGLKLSDYKLVPNHPAPNHPVFDDAPQADSRPLPDDCPEGYELFARTLQALKERYPFRAAVLELKTILRIIMVSCARQGLEKLSLEDYAMLLCLLDEMDTLTERCRNCPLGPATPEASHPTQ